MAPDLVLHQFEAPDLLRRIPGIGSRLPEIDRENASREGTCFFVVAVVHGSRDLLNLIDPDDLPTP